MISRKLAHRMGGDAGATSELGKGSTFWATVKLSRCGDAPAALQPDYRGARIRIGCCVLLVEDNQINQELAKELLEARGIAVNVANNGAEAVEKIKTRTYDLVLMDMQMPVMDGLEATRVIRDMPHGKAIPIIAMTANAFEEDRKRCRDAGMNDFVTKPVEPERLYQTLARWIPEGGMASTARLEVPQDAALSIGNRGLIDSEAGLKFFGGRQQLYQHTLGLFSSRHLADADGVQKALQSGDPVAAERIAHSLKSSAATLGIEAVRRIALELEQGIHGGLNFNDLADKITRLRNLLADVEVNIRAMRLKNQPIQAEADPTRVDELLPKLESQLIDNDVQAKSTWMDLGPMLARIDRSAEVEYLGKQIEAFNFPDALETLRLICDKHQTLRSD